MHHKVRLPHVHFSASLRPDSATLAILVLLLFLLFVFLFLTLTAPPAQAQTYNVIHNFTGGLDGSAPYAGLTIDAAGNLYGTSCGALCATSYSGAGGVFRLSKSGSGWLFTPLYTFRGGTDGSGPAARVVIGPDGSLYGTTYWGGESGNGTIFNLKPPASVSPNISGSWIETVLYSFAGDTDGANPYSGDLIFDHSGSLYGTTTSGGSHGQGTVYKLAPSPGGWTKSVLYSFTGGNDGGLPIGGLLLDVRGNLYGTTFWGGGASGCAYGNGCGTIFELTPSGSGWTERTLYSFQGGSDGGNPVSGLIFNSLGHLYGTTSWGGALGGGTAFVFEFLFQLNPTPLSGRDRGFPPGPWASLALNTAEGVYGTTSADGAFGFGSAFELNAECCTGCFFDHYNPLHDFTGGSDGANPFSSLVLDANGNIFGTTSAGGAYGQGVVFEITPAAGSEVASADSFECSTGQ